jgi:adenylosuccinate lyase
VHSQQVLLALTQAGLSREAAYAAVQRCAMRVWEKGADFRAELEADAEVAGALGAEGIGRCFDLAFHTAQVDAIFARVFGA